MPSGPQMLRARPGRAGRKGTRNNLATGRSCGPSLPFLQSTRREPGESGLPRGLSLDGTLQSSYLSLSSGHPGLLPASPWAPSLPCLGRAHCLSTLLAEEAAATGGIGGGAECVNHQDFPEGSERALLRVGSVFLLDLGCLLCTQIGWQQPEGWKLDLIHSFNKLIRVLN